MKKFEYNSLEHLVFNASFRRWVLTNDETDAAYWDAWLNKHPEKAELVTNARTVIQALNINFKRLSNQEVNTEISNLINKLDDSSPKKSADTTFAQGNSLTRFIRSKSFFKAAAAAIFLIVAGYLVVAYLHNDKKDPVNAFLAKEESSGYENIVNTSNATRAVQLPDGSTIMLGIKSNIVYAKKFSSSYREVYLAGEAFFEVAKDPLHPFFVYTNTIVTKVLGTSFTIKSYPAEQSATVMVKTGKVTVFKRKNFNTISVSPREAGAKIITANQQVVFSSAEKDLYKTIIEKPVVIAPLPPKQNLVFSATPVSEVFSKLQQLYGIAIIYDSNILSNCSLSASLEDETFYEKLDIICKAINAGYEAVDGNIIINSKGCK